MADAAYRSWPPIILDTRWSRRSWWLVTEIYGIPWRPAGGEFPGGREMSGATSDHGARSVMSCVSRLG
jgi:hypothetical protein